MYVVLFEARLYKIWDVRVCLLLHRPVVLFFITIINCESSIYEYFVILLSWHVNPSALSCSSNSYCTSQQGYKNLQYMSTLCHCWVGANPTALSCSSNNNCTSQQAYIKVFNDYIILTKCSATCQELKMNIQLFLHSMCEEALPMQLIALCECIHIASLRPLGPFCTQGYASESNNGWIWRYSSIITFLQIPQFRKSSYF